MNFCLSDMYELPHTGAGEYGVGGHCLYPAGEGPAYGHCEPQPLHHPPCMEQTWGPAQHYSCLYGGAAFKNELCNVELPVSHLPPTDCFPDIRDDFCPLQWLEGGHRKGRRGRG